MDAEVREIPPRRRKASFQAVVPCCHACLRLAWLIILVVCAGRTRAGSVHDIRHVVIFMQENRSFDHYFGSLKGVNGFGDRTPLTFTNGKSDFHQPFGSQVVLPYHVTNQCLADLDHSWGATHSAWHGGKWDQWAQVKGVESMAYYTRADLPYYYGLAEAYTICDAYFCSVLGPTNPNRMYLWTGTIDPRGLGGGPEIDNSEPSAGFRWTTYPERLQSAGITWKIYQEPDNFDDNALAWFAKFKAATPGMALYDRGLATVPDLVTAFRRDVLGGTLPQVSWIIAPTALSEHPAASPASGARLTKQLLDTLASNPSMLGSTVFFLVYDENDGFFDHVPPPTPPTGTADEFVRGLPIGLGVRVPMIIVSPWTRGGFVCSQVFDHTSIIRFLETWTGVQEPNISTWRRAVCGDLTSALDFNHPDLSYPILPSVAVVACSGGISPPAPSLQQMPDQEPGVRIARPLPWQINAGSRSECDSGLFHITLTNSGATSAHFTIYANAYRTDGPWQYDTGSGSALEAKFSTLGTANGRYDLTCLGPDGFLRRYAGSTNVACGAVEIGSELDPVSGKIYLITSNLTANTFSISVHDNLGGDRDRILDVPANGSIRITYPTSADYGGAYDVSVTAGIDAIFLRQMAGRIQRSSPHLEVMIENSSVVLSYPTWASGALLESTTTLGSDVWHPVHAFAIPSTNRFTVPLPVPTTDTFFRLTY